MRVSVAFPGEVPADAQAAAATLAEWFAGRVLHVSHAQLDACNELNHLFQHGTGVVTGVDAAVKH
jgi:hypothetical protein